MDLKRVCRVAFLTATSTGLVSIAIVTTASGQTASGQTATSQITAEREPSVPSSTDGHTAGLSPPTSPTRPSASRTDGPTRGAERRTADLTSRQRTSPAGRELRYEELAEMVDAFELRNAILRNATDLIRPTVVHIEAQKKRAVRKGRVIDQPIDENNMSLVEEAGSGVIVRYGDQYVVLTNRHVVNNTPKKYIRVHLYDGRSAHPTRIVADPSTDVAILELDMPNLIAARIGNSDELSAGDFVLAFGSPFGLSHSVTQGIVSAKGRRDLMVGSEQVRIQNFIQTDAAINPGNSGGPLANLRGEIVGINTAIASDSGVNAGIGFATPINIAMFVGKQLVTNGRVRTAYLGVKLQSDFGRHEARMSGLPELIGARISRINPGSPAEAADLRVNDVVYKFNGITVENDSHLVQLVSLTPTGTEVPFVVYRNGKPMTIVVELNARHDSIAAG